MCKYSQITINLPNIIEDFLINLHLSKLDKISSSSSRAPMILVVYNPQLTKEERAMKSI